MSHDDRGAYTPPSEAPLSFDARQPVRGSSPVPTTLIASVVLLTIVVGAALLFFRNGIPGQSHDPAQPVGTTVAQARTPAPAEAQPNDPTEGLQIYRTDTPATNQAPTFVAPPEAPTPRPAPAPVRVAEAPPAPAPVAGPAPRAPQLQVAIAPTAPAPKAAPAPTPPPPRIAAPPAPAPAAQASGAGTSVQVGAFSSRALAEQGWNDAVRVAPGAAAGRGSRYEQVLSGDRTLYRTFVTGFASRADAQAFCDQLRAAGRACYVR